MKGRSKIIPLVLIGLAICSSHQNSSKKPCPDLNKPKWTRGAQNALMNLIQNNNKIHLKRCLPEVTDFSCARLSRNFDGYKEACLAFIWNHKTYEGTLKATTENNLNEHCVLTFNRKSKDTLNALKSREKKLWNFRTTCFENLWNEWSEWSTCGRRSKLQKRRRSCNRQQFKDQLLKRVRTLVPTKYLRCEADSKTGNKHQRRDCTSDKRSIPYKKGPQGRWSGWSAWSMCSHTCGTGIKIRTRKCWTGHGECDGPDRVSLDCMTGIECPKKIMSPIAKTPIGLGKNCGSILEGCGEGECIKLLSGADHCQCFEDAIKNDNGTCSANPEIDATLPTTEEDCRLWTFFLNGEELSKETCLRIVHDHDARQSFQIMIT